VIENYNDLYTTLESAIEEYSKEEGAVEVAFKKNENGTCTVTNKENGNHFVFMFAQFGDEYKVGFAFYVPDQYGGVKEPEWIEDIFNHEFDQRFVLTLITEHLTSQTQQESDW
jgi:hypothetical protein